MGELKGLKSRYEPWQELVADMGDLELLLELAEEAGDESQSAEIEQTLQGLNARFDKQNIYELMPRG